MVQHIIAHLGILPTDGVLDFGCARGYMVKAFRRLGFSARGYDVSRWAVDNCDPEVSNFISNEILHKNEIDWVIAKDVLEHVKSLDETIFDLMGLAKMGLFVVVPLSAHNGHPYVVKEYEKDTTHIWRLSLDSWVKRFMRPGWVVEAQYRVKGIKDNYAQYPTGNGFLTMRRTAI
jgi:predicted TPR repeat methyltransferase